MSMSSVLGKDWVSKTYNEESVNFLKDNLNLSEITSKLIAIRKIKVADVNLFLKPKIKNLIPDPFVLKDMEKAVSRTVQSIQKKIKLEYLEIMTLMELHLQLYWEIFLNQLIKM